MPRVLISELNLRHGSHAGLAALRHELAITTPLPPLAEVVELIALRIARAVLNSAARHAGTRLLLLRLDVVEFDGLCPLLLGERSKTNMVS